MRRPVLFTRCCFFACLMTVFIVAPLTADDKKTEPTNAAEAAEAAEKKAEQEAALNKKFADWKATLSPEQQAWETVLEENLGGFYLPIYKKQKVAGQVTAWDFVADDPKLPRVLLIGDSVSRGYTQAARKALQGKANVHRAPANCGPTAMGLKKLDVWLGAGNWDVIHFNFGIHDRRTPAAEYEQRLDEIAKRLKKTGATVVWASSTPIPADWKEGPEMKTKRDCREGDASQRRGNRRPVYVHHAASGRNTKSQRRAFQWQRLRHAGPAGGKAYCRYAGKTGSEIETGLI